MLIASRHKKGQRTSVKEFADAFSNIKEHQLAVCQSTVMELLFKVAGIDTKNNTLITDGWKQIDISHYDDQGIKH
jgi:hypothetical protein